MDQKGLCLHFLCDWDDHLTFEGRGELVIFRCYKQENMGSVNSTNISKNVNKQVTLLKRENIGLILTGLIHALIHVGILNFVRACVWKRPIAYRTKFNGFYLFDWQYFLWKRVMNVYPIKFLISVLNEYTIPRQRTRYQRYQRYGCACAVVAMDSCKHCIAPGEGSHLRSLTSSVTTVASAKELL